LKEPGSNASATRERRNSSRAIAGGLLPLPRAIPLRKLLSEKRVKVSSRISRTIPSKDLVRSSVSAPAHVVEFSVRAHGSYVRHAVRQPEEGGDRGDVPDVLLVEAIWDISTAKSASPTVSAERETLSPKSSIAFWRSMMSAFR